MTYCNSVIIQIYTKSIVQYYDMTRIIKFLYLLIMHVKELVSIYREAVVRCMEEISYIEELQERVKQMLYASNTAEEDAEENSDTTSGYSINSSVEYDDVEQSSINQRNRNSIQIASEADFNFENQGIDWVQSSIYNPPKEEVRFQGFNTTGWRAKKDDVRIKDLELTNAFDFVNKNNPEDVTLESMFVHFNSRGNQAIKEVYTIYTANQTCFNYLLDSESITMHRIEFLRTLSEKLHEIYSAMYKHADIIFGKYDDIKNTSLLNYLIEKYTLLNKSVIYKKNKLNQEKLNLTALGIQSEYISDLYKDALHIGNSIEILNNTSTVIEDIKVKMNYYKSKRKQLDLTEDKEDAVAAVLKNQNTLERPTNNTDSYTNALLYRLRGPSHIFWENTVKPLHFLYKIDTFYMLFSIFIILFSHLIFFTVLEITQYISDKKLSIIEYYIHLICNAIFSVLLAVYTAIHTYISYRSKQNNLIMYKNILSKIGINQYIIRYSVLFCLCAITAVGNLFIIYTQIQNMVLCGNEFISKLFYKAEENQIIDIVIFSGFDLFFILFSVISIVLVGISLFKKDWIYKTERINIPVVTAVGCIIYLFMLIITAITYEKSELVNINGIMYRYHIGYVVQAIGILFLLTYHAKIYLKKSGRIKKMDMLRRTRKFNYKYLASIIIIGCISGIICSFCMYLFVINVHAELFKLSTTEIAKKLGVKMPLPSIFMT
ncbi:hypothetical protein NEIRO02_1706 [Nematocida sp. AWRm79]|nr:hypothetical protein NEIRO02_1706 [Nematocida sp. AWRm79]